MSRKGFTLIEMIGVIVIMGIILIVVIPTLSQMIHDNDNQEYKNYYALIEEGAQVYAGKLTDKLGTSKYTGCAEVTLDELIDAGYVQKFNKTKVTCETGAGNIKIRNNKGSISINFQLGCSKEGETIYLTGTNDSEVCEAYVMEEENTLKTVIESDESVVKAMVDNEVYVMGDNPNNYVWYSGKLWRVVSYNTITESVKAVTVNPITSIYYNSSTGNSSNFSGSDIETWINNEFLSSLKDSQTFLVNSNWNATPNTIITSNPTSQDKIRKLKVGLINTYEYGKIREWYGGNNTWILSEGTAGNSLYISSGSIQSKSSKTIQAVRPAVTFSSNVLVYSGTGSATNPYIIDNSSNAFGKSGEYINTRYSGEYVMIGTRKYRIVSTDGEKTKIIGTTSIANYMFSDNHFDYASSSLRETLENSLTAEMNLAINGDYCLDTINNDNVIYQSSKCLTTSRVNNSIKIGLPKIGDLFTTSIPGLTNSYWTLNPNTEIDGDGNHYNATMNMIKYDGSIDTSTISAENATVIVLYLDSSVKISSGTGTNNNPYVLTK